MKGPRTTVRVEGLSALEGALGELTKATARNVLRRVLTRAGEPIAETARRLAPDDPDTTLRDLRTSITVSPRLRNKVGDAEYSAVLRAGGSRGEAVAALRDARRASDGSFAEVYVGPSGGGEHGVPQEFGTVNHPPQPFMRPAWDQHKNEALEIVRRDLGGEIDKAARRAKARAAKKAAKASGQ